MRSLFFIHIPKTAGTSLRVALEKSLGNSAISADYGDGIPQTSADVQECIYGELPDPYQLALSQPRSRVLTGHVTASKYAPLFAVQDIFTLIREPITRVVSEFYHFQRHFDFQGNLRDFAKQKGKQNTMCRYLRRVPWQALGYVGTSDRYDEALTTLNQVYQLNLVAEVLNAKPSNQQASISAADFEFLRQSNQNDVLLYENIQQALDWRQHCQNIRAPYTHGNAAVTKQDDLLQGYAFYSAADERQHEPVQLKLQVLDQNQQVVTVNDVTANIHHAKMTALNAPRQDYVGFRVDLNKIRKQPNVTSIELRVKASEQLLWRSPI